MNRAGLALLLLAAAASASAQEVKRTLYLGAFYQFSDRYGDNAALPGNVAVVVEPGVAARVHRPVIGLAGESSLAVFLQGGDVPEIEQLARDARSSTRLPLLGYIDNGEWTNCPTEPDWIGVMAYRYFDEALSSFDARISRMIRSCAPKPVALIVQTYDTNLLLSDDVTEQFQYYFAWAIRFPNVIAVLAFSDGRSLPDCTRGGLRCRPRWHDQWAALVAALLGPEALRPPTGLKVVSPR
jgi:hypothetical protein